MTSKLTWPGAFAMMTLYCGNAFRISVHCVRGIHRSPVIFPQKGPALLLSLLWACTRCSIKLRITGGLRRHDGKMYYSDIKWPCRSNSSQLTTNALFVVWKGHRRTLLVYAKTVVYLLACDIVFQILNEIAPTWCQKKRMWVEHAVSQVYFLSYQLMYTKPCHWSRIIYFWPVALFAAELLPKPIIYFQSSKTLITDFRNENETCVPSQRSSFVCPYVYVCSIKEKGNAVCISMYFWERMIIFIYLYRYHPVSRSSY